MRGFLFCRLHNRLGACQSPTPLDMAQQPVTSIKTLRLLLFFVLCLFLGSNQSVSLTCSQFPPYFAQRPINLSPADMRTRESVWYVAMFGRRNGKLKERLKTVIQKKKIFHQSTSSILPLTSQRKLKTATTLSQKPGRVVVKSFEWFLIPFTPETYPFSLNKLPLLSQLESCPLFWMIS